MFHLLFKNTKIMKNIKLILSLFAILLFQSFALFSQTKENNATPPTLAARTYDPSKDAVGQRINNDFWVLKISELTLVNAAKSALSTIKNVQSIQKERVGDKNYLVLDCTLNNEQSVNLIIPLRQEFDGKVFIEQNFVVCNGNGCSGCSGAKCSCGSTDGGGTCSSSSYARFALSKWVETE
jgi:hypothetical protein